MKRNPTSIAITVAALLMFATGALVKLIWFNEVQKPEIQWGSTNDWIYATNLTVSNITAPSPPIVPVYADFSNIGPHVIALLRHPDSIPVPIRTNMRPALASNLWQRVLAKQAEANSAYAEFIEKMVR